MKDKTVRKKIKAVQSEIAKWREKIANMELLPCHCDKDLLEKEEKINALWNILRDLEKTKDHLLLEAMGIKKYHESSLNDEAVFEETITIVNEFRDNRGKNRYVFENPETVTVEFRIEKGSKKYRVRKAKVMNSSQNGFAFLVPPKSFDLLGILQTGDRIRDIAFFGAGAVTKKDGIVRHETRLTKGKYKGCYIIGIEAPDI